MYATQGLLVYSSFMFCMELSFKEDSSVLIPAAVSKLHSKEQETFGEVINPSLSLLLFGGLQ